jgi:pimeloyl-ACP methyl ester carboxylesterase
MADVVVRGARLHYERLGKGGAPQVVFVHGLVMDNLASYYFTFAHPVATFADVLLYDLRGHGTSERTPSGYSVVDAVLDLEGLLDATVGDTPVVLVGNSFGATVAVRFALEFPKRVRGLVLLDGHLGADDFASKMASTLSLRGEAADSAIAASFQHWLGRHSERKRNRLADHARALVEGTTLVDDLKRTTPLTDDDFAAVSAPTLALFGEKSDVLPRGPELVRQIPGAEIRILANCTHSILWEATAEVKDAIVGFVRRFGEATA